jgi:hypothetical protein
VLKEQMITGSKQQQMLARMRGKGTLHTVTRMQISPATMEISMEFPQKLKIKLPHDQRYYDSRVYTQRDQSQHTTEISAHPCLL